MSRELINYTAVVVDDEPLPMAHMANLLRRAGVGRVLKARNAAECLELFETEQDPPDWAFLDVVMPDMDGLALADALKTGRLLDGSSIKPPSVVYVTGHEEFAVQAFDKAAVDYLLKPVEPARLDVALDRLRSRADFEGGQGDAVDRMPAPRLKRLPIRMNYSVRLLELSEIMAANAHDKRVDVLTVDAVYPTYYTLNELEQRLPCDQFVRVHDAWIVNLEEVLEVHNLGDQVFQLRLRNDNRLIPLSRRRIALVRKLLGF